jgi:serine/threonine protein phosphatase 1
LPWLASTNERPSNDSEEIFSRAIGAGRTSEPTMKSKHGLNLFGSRDYAAVPPGQRLYAIGDVHGCRALLERLIERIRRDMSNASAQIDVIFLGDYIDRGPDSKGVVDLLIGLSNEFSVHFIRGNHDQALLSFLDDPATYREWKDFGADETLRSYGVSPPETTNAATLADTRDRLIRALPNAHMRFFSGLLPSLEIGDYLFVHAGIRPGVPVSHQTLQDLMWIRDEFLLCEDDFGKIVVHGHSPHAEPVRRDNRIGIDTGAYLTGRLTAVALEGTRSRFLRA